MITLRDLLEDVELRRTKRYREGDVQRTHYAIHDPDTHEKIGHTQVRQKTGHDGLYVDWIGRGKSMRDGGSNELGPSRMRQTIRKLAAAHGAKTISGHRMGGADGSGRLINLPTR